jgi:ABC-type sugar transport system ATPase subunit
VASFVGSPAINLFDAAMDGDKLVVVPEKFEIALQPAIRARLNEVIGPRSTVRVGVRPEDVKLIESGDIAGKLYGAEDHGVEMILTIQVADQLVRATSAATTRVPVNAPVQIAFAQDKLHFFDPETTKNLAQV